MRSYRRIWQVAIALAVALPALLSAQPSNAQPSLTLEEQQTLAQEQTLARDMFRDQTQTKLRDPSLSSPSRSANLQAILSGTTSNTQAAAEVGLTIKGSEDVSASVKVAGPIGKQNTDTKLASLTGLSDQATASVNLRWVFPSPVKLAFSSDSEHFIGLLCHAYVIDHPGVRCDAQHRKEDPTAVPADLSNAQFSSAAEREFLTSLGLGHGIGVLAFEGTYGAPKAFDFLSSNTFAKQEQRHSGDSLAASAGWIPLRPGIFFAALTYRYQRTYMSTPTQDICQPFGSLGASNCQSLPVGPPKMMTSNIGQLELRQYFGSGQVAINPRISRDFKQRITGIEIPVYFLKDGTGNLNGGISPGWRSDTKSVTITAFVGGLSNPLGSASSTPSAGSGGK